jgi:hypothetical protein
MNIKFSIFDAIGILDAFGEQEVSQSLKELLRNNVMAVSPRGFREVIMYYVDYSNESTDRTLVHEYIYNQLKDKEWYNIGLDTIELSFLPNELTLNDILHFCTTREYRGVHIKYSLFSRKFQVAITDILSEMKHIQSSLFRAELIAYDYKVFNKTYDRNFHCKTTDQELLVSYQAKNKNTIMSDSGDAWKKETRTSAKPIRVIKKVRTLFKYSDSFYEELNNKLVAHYVDKGEFVVFTGDDIVKYYHEDKVESEVSTGSLGNSCMRYDSCQDYLRLYSINPEVISMLTYLNQSGKVTGRALLWMIGGQLYMDRIYGSDSMIHKFIKYAKENDIIWKAEQSYSDPITWCQYIKETDSVSEFERVLKISLKNARTAPYMDTFKYVDNVDDDYIELNNSYGDNELTCTDGNSELFDGDYVTCAISDERMDADDDDCILIDGDYYNERYCAFSDRDDRWYLKTDVVHIDGSGYVLLEDTSYISFSKSRYVGEYVLCDDAVWINSIGEDVHVDESYYNDISNEDYFITDELVDVSIEYVGGYKFDTKIDRGSMDAQQIINTLTDEILSITIEGVLVYEKKEEEVLVND